MELQSGLGLLIQQYKALLKNIIVSWRNRRSTIAQLLSPFFFVFLLYAISQALANQPNSVYDPQPLLVPPIPPCEDKFFITLPCFDFAWSGNDTALIVSIVDRIMNNNPARPIPPNKVKSFRTKKEVDEWLYNNPTHCPGALHFAVRNKTVISYGVQTNSTQIAKRNQNEDPTFKFQIPLQIAAEREIARTLIGGNLLTLDWDSLNDPNEQAKLKSKLIQEAGPAFFLAIAMFGFVFQIRSLVTEKELKLHQAMTMMGLYDTAYWLSWLTWETLFALFSSLLTVLCGMIMMLRLKGFPYKKKVAVIYRIMWSLFPPNLLSKAIELLAFATATAKCDGISWSKRSECSVPDCVITIGTGKGGNKVEVPQVEHKTPDDEDVFEEENTVKQQAKEGIVDPNVAVQIRGLVKTYPGKIEIGCCKLTRKSHFHAVKGVWLNIPKDQLFCLLGPNGAGKTTSISCLTGIAPVTSGDALIYGHSVRSSVGMTNIRKIIGVCPQFDILWDILTGEEHLHLFASIKGLPDSSIKLVAQKSLAEVRLTEATQRRAGSYSGGMKRRLSVAIALIGDSKLVILDEPTTGMDPITRRHVWDIIENAKKGRAIILTTHSMEEADILSDRIGIVAKGTLCCIGTSIRLKSRFGSGIVANMSFTDTTTSEEEAIAKTRHEALRKFFKHHLNVVPKEETNYFLSNVIANEKEHLLTNFFAELQERESEFGIADIQLGLTTLEEVFLNVASKAALETATVENNLVTLTLTSGTSMLIPVGVKHIGIPRTESPHNPRGLMVKIY
ncbi:unnamed protein product [Camellia sinensis]